MASVKSYNHPKGNQSRTGSHAEGFTKGTKAGIQKTKRGVKSLNRQIMRFISEGRLDSEATVLGTFIPIP